jgi:hypothetical protein
MTLARLNTIAIDSQSPPAPAQWSAAWVQRRLIEAYSVERRLPRTRQRAFANGWPSMVVEFTDVVGRADEARQQILQDWEHAGAGVSAEEIGRMEDAHDWLRTILGHHPIERLCLAQWATAIAYRRSVRRMLAQRRWSRTTFYRYVTAGAHVVALELQRQGEPVT